MEEKEVVEASKRIGKVPRDFYFITSMFLICGSPILSFASLINNSSIGLSALIFGVSIFIGSLLIGLLAVQQSKEYQSIEKWKKEFVSPFINSLPQGKSDIVQLQIFMTPKNEQAFSPFYTNKSVKNKRKVQVTFVDNEFGLISREDYFDVLVDLESGKKPFISYQHVKKDLGFNVESGYYNPTIHLPKDYNFN